MSNIMHVLEQMGSDASLQNEDAIQNILTSTELESEITQAIANKDVISLARQLDVCPDIVCIIHAPDDDEKEEEKEDDDEDSTEESNQIIIGF